MNRALAATCAGFGVFAVIASITFRACTSETPDASSQIPVVTIQPTATPTVQAATANACSKLADILLVSNKDTQNELSSDWCKTSPTDPTVCKNPRTEIYTSNLNGNMTRITTSKYHHFIFGFDPRHCTIVASRAESDTNGNAVLDDWDKKSLWLIDLKTGAEKRLSDPKDHAEGRSFSPDGEWIVYLKKVLAPGQNWITAPSHVWKIRRDGTHDTQLTNTSSFEGDPAFSHDGRYIAFMSFENSHYVLKRMNSDGSHPITIYAGEGLPDVQVGSFVPGNYDPAFSPDDQWIVFERAVHCDLVCPDPTQACSDAEKVCNKNWGSGVWHIFKAKNREHVTPSCSATDGVCDLSCGDCTGIGFYTAEFLPSYSPDGKTIIFGSIFQKEGSIGAVPPNPDKSHVDIVTRNLGGGDYKVITTSPWDEKYPLFVEKGAIEF